MKLDIKTDFTSLPKAGSVLRAGEAGVATAFDKVTLPHDERHLRRKVLSLAGGGKLLVDLPEPVMLAAGDRLVLDDGRQVEIGAEPEELLEARARDAVHLAELAWHIGNRHLAAQIEAGRLLILRDHVIEDMLKGLDAAVRHVVEPFQPVRGAYSGHGHDHHHHDHDHHGHGHDHHHGHGEPDAFGRLPGDPHYGHNHA
jgi:urease accessory protein